eukprot:2289701-Pleurochrysis_carterae.AAC.1
MCARRSGEVMRRRAGSAPRRGAKRGRQAAARGAAPCALLVEALPLLDGAAALSVESAALS